MSSNVKRQSIFVLLSTVLFAAGSFSLSYGSPKGYINKAVEYAVEGKFKLAKKEFSKLKTENKFPLAGLSLNILNDAISGRLKKETVIHIFKGIDFSYKGKCSKA